MKYKYADFLHFRVKEEQRALIKEVASLENMNITSFCRKIILDYSEKKIKENKEVKE